MIKITSKGTHSLILIAGLIVGSNCTVAESVVIGGVTNDEEPANGWIVEDGVLSQTQANEDFAPWGDRAAVVGEIADIASAEEVSTILQFHDYAGRNGIWAGISISKDAEFPDHTVTLILERSEDDNVRGGMLLIDGKEAARDAFPWDIRQPVQLRLELPGMSGFITGVFSDPETGEELLRLRSDGPVSLLASEQSATVFAACSAQYGYDTNPAVGFAAFQGLDNAVLEDDYAKIDGALARLDFATARFLERRHFARPLIDQQENVEYVERLSGMAEWSGRFVAKHPATALAQRANTWEVRATQLANRAAPSELLVAKTPDWAAPTQELLESPWRDEYTRQLWKSHPHDLSSPEGTETFLQDLYSLAGDESIAPYVRADVLYHSAVRAYRSSEHAVADEIARYILSEFQAEGFRTHARMTRLDVMMKAHDLDAMSSYCERIRRDTTSTREDLMVADLYEGTLRLYLASNSEQADVTFQYLQPVLDRFGTFHTQTDVVQEAAYWALRRGMMACLRASDRDLALDFLISVSVDRFESEAHRQQIAYFRGLLENATEIGFNAEGKFYFRVRGDHFNRPEFDVIRRLAHDGGVLQ